VVRVHGGPPPHDLKHEASAGLREVHSGVLPNPTAVALAETWGRIPCQLQMVIDKCTPGAHAAQVVGRHVDGSLPPI